MGINALAKEQEQSFGFNLHALRNEAGITHEILSEEIRKRIAESDALHKEQQRQEIEYSLSAIDANAIRLWEGNHRLPEQEIVPLLADILIRENDPARKDKQERLSRAWEETKALLENEPERKIPEGFGKVLGELIDEAKINRPELAEFLRSQLKEKRQAGILGKTPDMHLIDDEGGKILLDPTSLQPTHYNDMPLERLSASVQFAVRKDPTELMEHPQVNALPSADLYDPLRGVFADRQMNTGNLDSSYATQTAKLTQQGPTLLPFKSDTETGPATLPVPLDNAFDAALQELIQAKSSSASPVISNDPAQDIAFTSVALAAYLTKSGNTKTLQTHNGDKGDIILNKAEMAQIAVALEHNQNLPETLHKKLSSHPRILNVGHAAFEGILDLRKNALERLDAELKDSLQYIAMRITGDELKKRFEENKISHIDMGNIAKNNRKISRNTVIGTAEMEQIFDGVRPDKGFDVALLLRETDEQAHNHGKYRNGGESRKKMHNLVEKFINEFEAYDLVRQEKLKAIETQTTEFEKRFSSIKNGSLEDRSEDHLPALVQRFLDDTGMASQLPHTGARIKSGMAKWV